MSKKSGNNELQLDIEKIRTTSLNGKIILVSEIEGELHYLDNEGLQLQTESENSPNNTISVQDIIRFNNTDDVIKDIIDYLQQYLHLKNLKQYTLLAFYIVLSYCYDVFERIPYLHLIGEYGSGKTKVLNILNKLLYNPKMYSQASTAAIYRVIDQERCVLILDELENIGNRTSGNNLMIMLLNSGYQKDGKVVRVEAFEPIEFSTFCPKIIASKNELHPSTADRCILIEMEKAPNTLKTFHDLSESTRIKQLKMKIISKLNAVKDNFQKVLEEITPEKAGISNRDYDRWHSLLVLSRMFSSDETDYMAEFTDYISEDLKIKEDYERTLPKNVVRQIIIDFTEYAAARTLIPDNNAFYFKSKKVQQFITEHDNYNSYRNKSEITKVLKDIGIETTRRRFGGAPITLYKIPKSLLKKEN